MKKLVLLLSAVAVSGLANAQLQGSSYTENFDNVGNPGLPEDWSVYTNATETSLGTSRVLLSSSKGTKYTWVNSTGGFKNVASGNGSNSTASVDSATQWSATDRALAVRQVGNTNANFPNSDPGAAFVFRAGDTKNISALKLEFKLQSLDDTSHRQTTWVVDYGVGNPPATFTELATMPAVLTTGGDVFSNTTVTADLPAAVDNSSIPVYIRIRAKDAAIIPPGSQFAFGNRATTAIDDFKLTWTGNATSGVAKAIAAEDMSLSVLGVATRNEITIGYDLEKSGEYKVAVYDMAGREVYANVIATQSGKQKYIINGIMLNSGMYIVKLVGNNVAGIVKTIIE